MSNAESQDLPTTVDPAMRGYVRGAIAVVSLGILLFVSAIGFTLWRTSDSGAGDMTAAVAADPAHGRAVYLQNCASCHGPRMQGMPHRGAPLLNSAYMARASDEALFELLMNGREPTSPESTMKLYMPPKGGNPTLEEADLRAVITFMRQFSPRTSPAESGLVSGATARIE